VLKYAVRWGHLERNVATMVDPPRQLPREMQVWDEEQVRLFLAEAKRSSPHHVLYLTAILGGLRSGELAGSAGRMWTSPSAWRMSDRPSCASGKQQFFKAPKTAASRRTVALPPAIVEALRQVRSDQEENRRLLGADYHDHGLVFCQADGKPLHMRNVVQRDFREVTKRAGVPRITFHQLRHAHASYLARAGVDPKTIQTRLGHSTPHFSLRVYAHTLPGQQEAAALAVEEQLLGTRRTKGLAEEVSRL